MIRVRAVIRVRVVIRVRSSVVAMGHDRFKFGSGFGLWNSHAQDAVRYRVRARSKLIREG